VHASGGNRTLDRPGPVAGRGHVPTRPRVIRLRDGTLLAAVVGPLRPEGAATKVFRL